MQQPAVALKPFALLPLLFTLLTLGLLGGCARLNAQLQTSDSIFGVITPYRIEIVQGNVVTSEQIAQVKPGMTRQQVRDVLGSPLLTDIFHADRWDYVFTIKRPGTTSQERRIVLHFDRDTLKSVEAPPLPSEKEFDASITRSKDLDASAPVLELTEAQRQALPAPRPTVADAPASAAAPSSPARAYPPLDAS